ALAADPQEIEDERQRVNARAHTLVSQFMRSVYWLPDYDIEDYGRVEERFADILINGLLPAGHQPNFSVAPLEEDAPPERISRDSFLMAATQLINEQGYRGASVEAIAARLNVTKGSFYHHIDAKEDLVVMCFERSFALLRRAQRNAIHTETLGLYQAR